MLPVVAKDTKVAREMIGYTLAMIACSLLLVPAAGMTWVYAVLATALGVWFLVLCVRVIVLRQRSGVGFGSGGDAELERRARIQGNFAEYVPLALLLLGMAELRWAGSVWLHLGCALLLAGRLAHAVGLSRPSTDQLGRVVGMTGSQSAILLGAALLLWSSCQSLLDIVKSWLHIVSQPRQRLG